MARQQGQEVLGDQRRTNRVDSEPLHERLRPKLFPLPLGPRRIVVQQSRGDNHQPHGAKGPRLRRRGLDTGFVRDVNVTQLHPSAGRRRRRSRKAEESAVARIAPQFRQ